MNFDYLTIVDGAVLPDEVDNIFKSGAQACPCFDRIKRG